MIIKRICAGLVIILMTFPHHTIANPQSSDSVSTTLSKKSENILAVPAAIDYQASIYDASGVPLDGSITITFSIWDQLYSGNMLWSEEQSVYVRDGYITAELGLLHNFSANLFGSGNRYLQVNIQGEDLTPRKRLVSVPFSFYSNNTKLLSGHSLENFYTKSQANSSEQNTIDAHKLGGHDYSMYLTIAQLDARYVKKGQFGIVTGDMIMDGSIQEKDLGFSVGSGSVSNLIAGEGLVSSEQDGAVTLALDQNYKSGNAYNAMFVRQNQASAISSAMIRNEAITSEDIKNSSITPQDCAFTIGTINNVSAGVGLSGGGNSGSVLLSLSEAYRSGAAYDTRFIKFSSSAAVTSQMIKNNEITSEDIRDGAIQPQDMAFHYGDITSIHTANGITGGAQAGDIMLSLEAAYISGQKWDNRFVNAFEPNSINSAMIQNGSIRQEDLGFPTGDITAVYTTGGLTGGNSSGELTLQLSQAYLSGSAYSGTFVNENQSESISSIMIQDRSIQSSDLGYGVVRGEHFDKNLTIQQNAPVGGVINGHNASSSSASAGLAGKGYMGLKGTGNSIGVYGEAPSRAIYGRCTTSAGYGLFIEGRAHCTTNDWGDLAEFVPSPQNLEAGDVVIIHPDANSEIIKCSTAEDTRVAGIISTSPTITVGVQQAGDGRYALALAGIVPCKVVGDIPIAPGDLLTSSDVPGHAVKAVNPKLGTIIGKAMESFSGGRGKIRVLVTLQ